MNPVSTLTARALLLVSALGLVLAFAGSAVAGSLITSRQIKDDTITSADLHDGGLRGVDVRDGSLTRADFGPLPRGAMGAQGSPGLPGHNGVQGVSRRQKSVNLLGQQADAITVDCAPGTHLVGGGLGSDTPADLYVEHSAPTSTGWKVLAQNLGGGVMTVTAVAVCAS